MTRIASALLTALLLSSCMMLRRPPSDPKFYEPNQPSAEAMYHASFAPAESIKVGRLHSWTVRVTAADGTPVEEANITVDGGMPQHGHGLPTKPVVTRQLGDGRFMVEGMKFNMGGWWVVTLAIDGESGRDVVTFNLKL